jgi:hypothetical protein
MANYQVKFQATISGAIKGGISSVLVSADSIAGAKEKVKSMYPTKKLRIISCVKMGH